LPLGFMFQSLPHKIINCNTGENGNRDIRWMFQFLPSKIANCNNYFEFRFGEICRRFNSYPRKSLIATGMHRKENLETVGFQSLPHKIINCNRTYPERRTAHSAFQSLPHKIINCNRNQSTGILSTSLSFNPYPRKSLIATVIALQRSDKLSYCFNPYPIKSSIAT